jgi:hypothetical protein
VQQKKEYWRKSTGATEIPKREKETLIAEKSHTYNQKQTHHDDFMKSARKPNKVKKIQRLCYGGIPHIT